MSFIKRRLDVTISLGKGKFGDEQGPDMTLSGYRMTVDIPVYASFENSQLTLLIHGLNQDLMNRLTTIGPIMKERRGKDLVRINAASDFSASCVVYEGDIVEAWASYGTTSGGQAVLGGVFTVKAEVAGAKQLKSASARSFRGAKQAQEIMCSIAKSMGYKGEKNGQDYVLADPYFSGTDMDQLRSCAKAARVNFTIDRGVLSVWPQGGFRAGDPILLAPETGLIGYPAFTSKGLELKTLYNPNFGLGKRVQVISTIEPAHGEWIIVSLSHKLEAEVPGGVWQSVVVCERNLNG
ncbi:baseplate hub protein [Achromobacter aegrifaciens]